MSVTIELPIEQANALSKELRLLLELDAEELKKCPFYGAVAVEALQSAIDQIQRQVPPARGGNCEE